MISTSTGNIFNDKTTCTPYDTFDEIKFQNTLFEKSENIPFLIGFRVRLF